MVKSLWSQQCFSVGLDKYGAQILITDNCDEDSWDQKWKFENYVEIPLNNLT